MEWEVLTPCIMSIEQKYIENKVFHHLFSSSFCIAMVTNIDVIYFVDFECTKSVLTDRRFTGLK